MFTTKLSRFERNQRRGNKDGGYRVNREKRKGFLNLLSRSVIKQISRKRIKLEKLIAKGLIIRDPEKIAKRWGPGPGRPARAVDQIGQAIKKLANPAS